VTQAGKIVGNLTKASALPGLWAAAIKSFRFSKGGVSDWFAPLYPSTSSGALAMAEIIANWLPGGRVGTVEGASHFMTATHPTQVAAIIAEDVTA
jgi:pimeloyl-ACP methyl ester carboxylesterase